MTKSQKATVAVMVGGAFLSVLNQTLMNPALPAIMKELAVSATTVQWLVSGFTMVNAIVVALSAFLMDKFKTKNLFIASFALFFTGSLLAAWGLNFPMLLAGRFLQAICVGIMMPMSMTTLLLIFPHEKRGSAMGVYSFVIMFAPSIGPAISGILTDSVGWHITFLIMAVLAMLIIAVAAVFMKNIGETKDVRLDKPSVTLCAIGLFTLLYGFSEIGKFETLIVGIVMSIAGIVLLALFARRQLKLDKPFLQVGVLRDKQFRTGGIVLMLISASLAAAAITLPLYVQQVRGMSATISGMIMMPGAIAGAISGFFAGKLSNKIGTRPLAIIGVILVIIGSVGMAFWGLNTPVAVLIAIYCTRYIGLMLANTPISLWAISKLSNDSLNHGNALSNTMRQVANTFGIAVMVSVMSLVTSISVSAEPLKAQLYGIHATFYLSVAIAVVSLVMVMMSVRSKQATLVASEDNELASVMNTQPYTVNATDTLEKAISIFVEKRTAGLPILDADNKLVGFLTNGDIMRYLASQDVQFFDASASFIMPDRELMSTIGGELLRKNVMEAASRKHMITVEHSISLAHISKLFYEHKIDKIPVTQDGFFIGTISRIDVMRYFMKQFSQASLSTD